MQLLKSTFQGAHYIPSLLIETQNKPVLSSEELADRVSVNSHTLWQLQQV